MKRDKRVLTTSVCFLSAQAYPSIPSIPSICVFFAALWYPKMPPPSVEALTDIQVQERAVRRSRKQAREAIETNALISAAGTREYREANMDDARTLTVF